MRCKNVNQSRRHEGLYCKETTAGDTHGQVWMLHNTLAIKAAQTTESTARSSTGMWVLH
jgi:hypothetical protein